MSRRLQAIALGLCAIVIVGTGSLARAQVTAVNVDQVAVLSGDHSSITITGSMTCTGGTSGIAVVNVIQPKSQSYGVGGASVTCTGAPENFSSGVSVVPLGNSFAFQNGLAAVAIAAGTYSGGSAIEYSFGTAENLIVTGGGHP